jgi:hypothetical protein
MTEINHRTVQTNGIRMHVAEAGAGPLVLLCRAQKVIDAASCSSFFSRQNRKDRDEDIGKR